MELLIWAGGRWRRICPSGRVAGWRRPARFVCERRGALRELPLAALSSIVKGPRLPKQRHEAKPKTSKFTSKPYNRYGQNAHTLLPQLRKDASVQTDTESIQVKSCKSIQTSQHALIRQDNKENQVSRTQKRLRSASTDIIEARPFKQQKLDETEAKKSDNKNEKPQRNDTKKRIKHTSSKKDQGKELLINDETAAGAKEQNQTQIKSTQKIVRLSSTDSQSVYDGDQLKELIIHEEDVLLLRRYIETHNTNIDLLKYDEDDNYKTTIFFKINPLVRLKRCPRIAQMLKDRDANVTVHFARQLGLQSIGEDNERVKHKKTKYRYAKAVAMSRSTIVSEDKPIKKMVNVTKGKWNASRSYRKKQRRSSSKTNESESVVGSDSDTIYEARKTRDTSSQSESSSSGDAFELSKIKNRATKVTKPQLILDSDDNEDRTRKNKSADKEERRRNKNTNAQSTTESERERTLQTRNDRDNLKKVSTKHNDESSDQKSRQNHFKKPFIVLNSREKGNNKNNNVENHQAKAKDNKKSDDAENIRPKEKYKHPLLRRIVVPKRSSVPPGREYSMLEDQAIVAWLSASAERERAVNGNRVWRELQEGYCQLTGQRRSWHSLRNRYLRYVLPGLAALALPAAHAQRLRAHAALGALKSRKKMRRNSVFNLPPVRSASARNRPRPPPSPAEEPRTTKRPDKEAQETRPTKILEETSSSSSDSQEESSPKRRSLRSSSHVAESPSDYLRPRSPNKQKSIVNLYRTSGIKSTGKSGGRSPSKLVRRTKSPLSSPSYSELTRRFLRNRSTPTESPKPATPHHKRRLYNPQRPGTGNSPP